ncbi:hypothetical protein BDZ45DRAFT_142841 [Acephala macrosclerotiorum]|nr:hypothetical protein BDZ45DRAFT_142841 [Acephala macrosclerotiorum]
MMFQKTSIRIKHFITQRLNQSTSDLTRDLDDSRFTDLKLSISAPKRLSWLSQTPSPTENFPFRRTSSNATARSHPINHFSAAHSSASSLCSCECGENPAAIEYSLSPVDSSPVQPEILYLPRELPKDASEDAKTWRLIFPEPESSPQPSRFSSTSKSRIDRPSLTIIPFESPSCFDELAIEFGDDDETPRQSMNCFENSTMLSDNVEQLIRETDEAFKAVGTALADAKAATQGWYDTKPSTSVTRTLSISRAILRRENGKPRTSVSMSPKYPITGRKSGTNLNAKGKVKKPGKKKSVIFGRGFRSSPPPIPPPRSTANATTRWRLNELTTGMVDVFSGKRFRTEVDEMLTPTRIQKLKAQHLAEDAHRESEESSRTDTSTTSFEQDGDDEGGGDTPTEPFFLERLSERIDAARHSSSSPIPDQAPPIPEKAEAKRQLAAKQRTIEMNKKVNFVDPLATSASISRAGMIFDTFSFPAPPFPPPRSELRTARRYSTNSKVIPMLPTIPEISPLDINSAQFFTDSHSDCLPILDISSAAPSHILLPSTPFSLNAPWFRNGPIRIDRIVKPKTDTSWSPEEESLDWVAFQMAISGNMDEYGRDFRSDSMWEMDEVELDEIEAWWENYEFKLGGFKTDNKNEGVALTCSRCSPVKEKRKGEMKEVVKLKPKPKTLATIPSMKEVGVNKIAKERLIRAWKEEVDTSKVVLAAEDSGVGLPIPISIPSRVPTLMEARRPSLAESLPPSPMLDLGVVSPMKDGEIIPMGFNLGHDLGDFLRWESSYAGFMGNG